LGSGKQFYAFESEDGSHVIKFIKQSRRKPLPWLSQLSLPSPLSHIRDSYLRQRDKRLRELLESCRLASTELAEETGIIMRGGDFLAPHENSIVTLVDNLGIAHKIDLSETKFIFQKKALPLTTPFSEETINGMIQLTASLCHKGIVNLDPMINRNFGLIERKVILIDFGSLKQEQKVAYYPDFQRAIFLQLLSLREHLQNNQPNTVAYFDEKIQKIF
jgi:hypothetical protein